MKKNILKVLPLICMAFLVGQNLKAQSYTEEIDLFQSIFGMEKKSVVSDFLNIDSSSTFWMLYDEYERKRKDLGKERFNLLVNYAANYDSMDDEKYDELVKNMVRLRKDTDKLIDQYYKKVKKTSGPKVAAQFFQIENYFLSEIRTSILESIPYIGQFDSKD